MLHHTSQFAIKHLKVTVEKEQYFIMTSHITKLQKKLICP